MSILSKFKKYTSILSSKCIVYQPGRVGSTGVTNTAKDVFGKNSVMHLHSAGFDRVYCIKRPNYYRYINFSLAKFFSWLLIIKKIIKREKTLILVPLRDPMARNRSVFIEYFEILVAKAREEAWYRSMYKGNKSEFVQKVYDELLEHNGFKLWVDFELRAFAGDQVRGIEVPPNNLILIENFACRVCIFDVKNSKEVLLSQLGVESAESKKENTGNTKWCYDFLDEVQFCKNNE